MVAQDIENTAKPVGPENKSPYKVYRQEIRRTKYAEDGSILERGDDFDNEGNEIVAAGGASVEDSVVTGTMNYFVEGVKVA